jgi:hypothetical protein
VRPDPRVPGDVVDGELRPAFVREADKRAQRVRGVPRPGDSQFTAPATRGTVGSVASL